MTDLQTRRAKRKKKKEKEKETVNERKTLKERDNKVSGKRQ